MPTYEYQCKSCEHQFEAFQSMTAKALRKCPECGKNALERLIGTGAAVIFKGSGFYQTDYRSESYKKAAEAEKKAPAGPEAKTESKAEPKAEKKSEPKKPDKPKAGGSGKGAGSKSAA